MKKFKKFLAILLVASMIFTTNAVNVFAEGMNANQEEQLNEETTVGANVYGARPEDEENLTGAKLGEPEEDIDENLSEPEDDTRRGERLSEPALDEEEPEEEAEETTIEAKLGEPETEVKTESKTEVEEKLFGDPPIYTLSLEPNFPEGFSLPEGRSWYEDKSGPLYSDTDSILIEGWNTRICVDTAGNVCNLTGYNTKADGSGTRFSYQESISKEKLEYFDLPSDSYDLVLYAMWRTSKLYTIHYNQNLPEGYSLAEGSTWGNDATLWDYVDDFEFEIYDYTGMTCEDSDGKTLALIKWNTAEDGTGDDYSFGDWITSKSIFTDGELTLYAVWESVAPGPAGPYMYWIVDGAGDNKTIHYYASATDGDGRTAVGFDENGVVYTSLSDDERNSIKNAEFEEPIVATDVRRLFYYFIGLVSITDIGNLDTSNATSFKSIFEHCEAIKKIETSGLETNSLTDTSYMFTHCTSATDIILDDNFDTSSVINMQEMFGACNALTTINFGSKFDTSNVTDMRNMFYAIGAETLDLTKFKTSKVTDMYGMFAQSEQLKTINVSDDFKVNQVTDGDYMFYQCFKLVGGKGTEYTDISDPWGVAYAHIDEAPSSPGLFSGAPAPTTYTVTYNQNLPSGYSLSDGKTWYSVATTSDLSGHPIELKGSADMTCEDTSGNVRTLEGWNTVAELTGDKYNFGDKFSDASVFTSNPLTLYAIWSDPVAPGPAGSYIYWIVDGEGENKTIHYYNTDGTDRTKLEIGADGVVYKNLTKDDIKKAVIEEPIVATDARGFFQAFYELESIDNLTNLDTSNATSFEGMFSLCYKLDDINLSLFNTKKVTDTSSMFSSCSSLKSLTFGNNFDTSKVTNMAGMFDSCNSLTSITFGSKFKTNNVTNMRDMFCAVGLEKLDLTSFDTSKVTNMTNMFAQCGILKTIKVSDKFKVDQVTDSEYMFVECFNLVGGKGTLYDETTSPWDVKYAHIDEGPTNPGFFTAAPTPTPPTPPTPSPSPSYGGNTGGSDSDGSSSGGPINVTNNNLNNFSINNIPQSLLLNDPALYLQLMSYPENAYMQKTNAKDYYGNTGFGRWLRIPNTTTWYFYSGDFNGVGNSGFLKDGWFNLGWDGVDRWYRFDSNGVMQLGWYEENGKIYFLQNDLNDNWYGKAVTGTHVIDGVTYTFDSTGALIN